VIQYNLQCKYWGERDLVYNGFWACVWMVVDYNCVMIYNRTHVYMNFFDHKDLGNHLLQLRPKVVKHPVCILQSDHTSLKVCDNPTAMQCKSQM
jgi:hypothetical protein